MLMVMAYLTTKASVLVVVAFFTTSRSTPTTTDLLQSILVFAVASTHVPYHKVQGPPAEERLLHSSIVHLPGAVVELDSRALKPVPDEVNAHRAYFIRRADGGRWAPGNYAVDQAKAPTK